MKYDYAEQDGDICIEFHDQGSEYCCAIGRYWRGVFEWLGKDFKFHRFQGKKVLFTWESAVKIVGKLSMKDWTE